MMQEPQERILICIWNGSWELGESRSVDPRTTIADHEEKDQKAQKVGPVKVNLLYRQKKKKKPTKTNSISKLHFSRGSRVHSILFTNVIRNGLRRWGPASFRGLGWPSYVSSTDSRDTITNWAL